MQRAAFLLIAALAWVTLSGAARAQTNIGVSVLSFEGRTDGTFDLTRLGNTQSNPIGEAECGATIRFRFINIDTSRAFLRFFEGANCNDPAVRTSTTTTACQPLTVPDVAIEGRSQRDVDIVASDLVPCDEGGSGVRNVWVLALSNPNDTVTDPGQQHTFPIAYDFVAPSAPTSVTSGGGETDATISWTQSGEQVTEFQIFVDPNGCTDGTVTSPGLTSDPPDESLIAATAGSGARSTSVEFPSGVPLGGQMAVAVRGVDRAGNVGPLSTPICVDRFEVTSWWRMYCSEADAPEVCPGGGCAATPSGGRGSGALVASALLAFALVLRRRARR